MDVSRKSIDELHRTQREARRRTGAYLLAALPPLVLLLLHVIGLRAAGLAEMGALTGAVWWMATRSRARDDERRLADELILHGWRSVAPDSFDWRAGELCSARARRTLARALERQTEPRGPMAPMPALRSAPEVRQNRDRLRYLAKRLREEERPVDPRGVVLVARLVADVEGLALFHGKDGPQLERQLAQVEKLIDAA